MEGAYLRSRRAVRHECRYKIKETKRLKKTLWRLTRFLCCNKCGAQYFLLRAKVL